MSRFLVLRISLVAFSAIFLASWAAASDLPSAAQWQGKYPFDLKPGFYENAALRDAGTRMLGAKAYKDILLGWNTAAPILAEGGTLMAWSCKPHDCGENNQATLIDGDAVRICIYQKSKITWYVPDNARPLTKAVTNASPPALAKGCNFQTIDEARQSLKAIH
ncbi:MAG: hypothetical protein IPK66_03810 [Rhodospirillales bacterium]|nr:hypothetical protein [Rhodospirillales bacterium]